MNQYNQEFELRFASMSVKIYLKFILPKAAKYFMWICNCPWISWLKKLRRPRQFHFLNKQQTTIYVYIHILRITNPIIFHSSYYYEHFHYTRQDCLTEYVLGIANLNQVPKFVHYRHIMHTCRKLWIEQDEH